MKTKSLKPQIAAPVKREHFATAAAVQDASVDPSGLGDILKTIASTAVPLISSLI